MNRTVPLAASSIILACVIILGDATASAQVPAARYRVVASKESKFQEDVERVAADGYRLVAGDAAVEVAIFERSTDGVRRSYLFVPHVEAFLKDKKLQAGFRLVAPTLAADESNFSAVFEKSDGDEKAREYRFVKAGSVKDLRRRLDQGGGSGMSVIAVAAGQAGVGAILEQGSEVRPITLIASGNTGTLRQELQAAGEKGLCFLDSDGIKEAVYALAACPAGGAERGYEVLATTKTETLEQELNAAAARGLRLVPASFVGIEKKVPGLGLLGGGAYNYETVAVVEKSADPTPVTYRVLGTVRMATFVTELKGAEDDGFTLIAFTLGPKEVVAVLQKP